MKRSHGKNVGRSRKLRSKGRLTAARQLVKYAVGEKVRIDINPSYRAGMPHLRFNHRFATVTEVRGRNGITVKFMDGDKQKLLSLSNVHLARI